MDYSAHTWFLRNRLHSGRPASRSASGASGAGTVDRGCTDPNSALLAADPLAVHYLLRHWNGHHADQSVLAALIGLGLIASANMAEIYRGALASLHHGQWEAATALNFGTRHTLVDVVAPQAFRVALPSAASYLIGLMKETAVASTIGVADLAFRGNQVSQLTFKGIEVFALVGLFYIFLSLPVAWLSRSADSYLRAKVAR